MTTLACHCHHQDLRRSPQLMVRASVCPCVLLCPCVVVCVGGLVSWSLCSWHRTFSRRFLCITTHLPLSAHCLTAAGYNTAFWSFSLMPIVWRFGVELQQWVSVRLLWHCQWVQRQQRPPARQSAPVSTATSALETRWRTRRLASVKKWFHALTAADVVGFAGSLSVVCLCLTNLMY